MRLPRRNLVGFFAAIGVAAVVGTGIVWVRAPGKWAQGPVATAVPATKPAFPLAPQVKEVVSFLGSNCLECHDAKEHTADVVLETYKDADSIRKNRKQWERVLAMVHGGAMPPEAHDQPPKQEKEQFVAAAKAVLDYVDPVHPDPGLVTMRRLNRAEYDNTVYELLGINFSPSADFPPDDVGGGFDNNGDVLTLSPLLMEHYLTASESVIQQALPEGGSWPLHQKLEQYQPPAGGALFRQTSLGRDKIRHIAPGQRISAMQNNQTAIREEGDYIFRVFAYRHEGAGLDVPTMNLEVDDKVVATHEVNAVGYEGSIFYKAPVHLKPGAHKFGISWPLKEGQTAPTIAFDPTGKLEPPGLHVRWSEVVGPRAVTPAEAVVMAHKADAPPREAAREVINRFAARAFRRPATADEVEQLLPFYDDAAKEGMEWYDAVRVPLQAVLVSPNFLFRIETDDHPEAAAQHPVTDYQLASRLSYFLWSSMPDDELMALAAKNELHNHLEAQVHRMLKDRRADQLTANFASQWLHLRMLNKVMPDKEKFPEYNDVLKNAMLVETLTFFNHVVTEDRSVVDLINGRFTYLNQPLAELYGIVDTKGNHANQANPVPGGEPLRGADYVHVDLQPNDRAGVLTQASVLTVTSNPGRTSPVKRGKFIMEQFLGESPPAPPPNVPSLDVGTKAASTGNVRQRMEQHRADPRCAACHLEMDQIGFAFENFNPIGRFRSKDDSYDIDASGKFPDGTTFKGASELETVLMGEKDKFVGTLAAQLMGYGLGRQMQYFDKPAVDKIVKAAAADDYKFSRLIIEIVKSDPFTMRRGKDHVAELADGQPDPQWKGHAVTAILTGDPLRAGSKNDALVEVLNSGPEKIALSKGSGP